MAFFYKDLIVWQRAMEFARLAYAAAKRLPAEERYALSDQIRRAASFVPSNIAEGNGRASNKDYAHFLSISRGSLYETMTQLALAKDLGYLSDITEIEFVAEEIARMLGAMLKKYGAIE